MKFRHYFLSFIFIMSLFSNANAKWASFKDANLNQNVYNKEIKINKDGTFEETVELQYEILKDSGRDFAASFNMYYNSDCETLKILEARTTYNKEVYKVDPNFIEDKPLASSHHGFDQTRQVLIAFPKGEVGATIYIKFKMTKNKAELDGFYNDMLYFGDLNLLSSSHIKLRSEIPLHIVVNNPDKVLKVKKEAKDNFHLLEVILVKPIFKMVINEPQHSTINPKLQTWISLSSINKWDDLAKKVEKQNYAKIYQQELPKTFLDIVEIASKKAEGVEQINTVTSLLNDKIQYMGDWRSIEGRFMPRDLAKTAASQIGDCKDFSASTVAMLNKLGYKATVALVMRGVGSEYPENALPSLYASNHAMVKVIDKKGKIYWIDPTNIQSMADGIFPDIAGKYSLVLDPINPAYEKIPAIDYNHAQVAVKQNIELIGNNKIFEHGSYVLKNERTLNLTALGLTLSDEAIKDHLYNQISGVSLTKNNKKILTFPELKSRIVRDINIDYGFEQQNRMSKTNLGLALKINEDGLNNFTDIPEDSVTDIILDSLPSTFKITTVIKNVSAKNIESLNKEIKTPWLYISRKCKAEGGNLVIEQTKIIYKQIISNDDTKTAQFMSLKSDIEQNFSDISVILD